jgi:uncharacterized protein
MHIDSLWRYPIKGLSAESLPFVDLAKGYGFSFDRAYAVTDGSFLFDERRPEPMPKTRFLMLAKYERLALLKTRLDQATRELVVQEGDVMHSFHLNESDGRAALAEFLTSFLDAPLPGPAAVVHAAGHQFTDVSVHSTELMRSISLINLATVRDLERHTGRALDPLRFRANLYFDGAEAWSELDWLGSHLRCGDVLLRVVRRTSRCPATSVNPDNGTRDINLPVAIREYRDHGDCGIYAEVLADGRLRPGSAIEYVRVGRTKTID